VEVPSQSITVKEAKPNSLAITNPKVPSVSILSSQIVPQPKPST
jgi:hypothetical protein